MALGPKIPLRMDIVNSEAGPGKNAQDQNRKADKSGSTFMEMKR